MPRQSPSRNYRCGKAESKLNVIWLKSMSLIVEQSLFIVQKYCQFFSFSCRVFVFALLPLPPICLCFLFHQGVIKVAASKSLAATPQCDVILRSALLKRSPITLKNSVSRNIVNFFFHCCTVFVVALLPLPPICLCFLFHQGVIKVAASKFPSLAAAPQCDVILRSATY